MRVSRAITGCLSAALCGAVLALGACEMPQERSHALPEDPPADFGVAVTVFSPAGGSALPARFILEPDGSFRAATGAGAGEGTYPPIVRHLTALERRRVWWLTLDTGTYDPASPSRVGSPETFDAGDGVATALVTATVWGSRRSAAYELERADNAPARSLVSELAGLAWVDAGLETTPGGYGSAQAPADD